jgi:integrase
MNEIAPSDPGPVQKQPGRPRKVQVWEKPPYVPAAIRKMQHEHSAGLRILRHLVAEHPGDPFRQLVLFFQSFRIPAATGRKRQVADKTEDCYFNTLKRVLETLRKPLNMQVQNLTELSHKQVRAVTLHWEATGHSASSLATLNTVLRRFGIWIGKPDLAPLLADLVVNPQSAKRSTSRTEPKTWESSGIDPEDIFAAVAAECPVTAMQLRLGWAFGLRVEEQLMIRPIESHRDNVLFIMRGTKGGRLREVRIHHAWEAELLQQAERMADAHPQKILTPMPPRRLHQARNHYYYICRKVGLTQSGRFRNTPHGARHSFAARRYQLQSGLPPPVLGGPKTSREVDQAARQVIAEEMGHGRASVTGAYLGSYAFMRRKARKAERSTYDVGHPDCA